MIKLGWAKRHFNLLKAEVREFLRSEPYSFPMEENPQHPQYAIVAYVDRHPPDYWGLMIGDVVNNARSALDHLIHSISSDGDPRKLQFPICDIPRQINGRGMRGFFEKSKDQLKGVSSYDTAVIETFQPYNRTPSAVHANPLAILREINDADKHRLIHPVGAATAIQDTRLSGGAARIRMSGDSSIRIVGCSGLVADSFSFRGLGAQFVREGGTKLAEIVCDSPEELHLHSRVTAEVAFDASHPWVNGRHVLPTLSVVLREVEEVIRSFR